MRDRHRKLTWTAVGAAISATAVGYLAWGLRGSWGGLWEAFRRANYLYVAPTLALLAVVYVLRIIRWRVLLRPIKEVPYGDVASATFIGFMSSCVLPLRPGEIIRPYILHRKSGVSFGDAAGTALGLERMFDLIGVCFMLLVTWVLMLGRAEDAGFVSELADKAVFFAVLTAVGLAGLSALAVMPRQMLKLMGFFLRPLPERWRRPLMAFLASVTGSMRFLRHPGQVAMALLLSFVIWGVVFPVSTYVLALAFDLDLSLLGALVIQVCLTAAVAVPQAPGFIGPFHFATIYAAELFGVERGGAAAFAMMLWAVHVLPITAVGLAYLRRERLNLLRLADASRQAAGQEDPSGPEG